MESARMVTMLDRRAVGGTLEVVEVDMFGDDAALDAGDGNGTSDGAPSMGKAADGAEAGAASEASVCSPQRRRRLFTCPSRRLILECVTARTQYSSWLLFPEGYFVRNGDLYMLTPVDALFAALPRLVAATRQRRGLFQTREALLSATAEHGADLTPFCGDGELSLVCEARSVEEGRVYRHCERRTLAWLRCKLASLQERDGLPLLECLGVLSRYVHPRWIERLRAEHASPAEPPAGAELHEDDTAARLNYNQVARDAAEEGEAERFGGGVRGGGKAPRVAVGANRLMKVDKSGMKSLNKFFTAAKR